jgi:hypothetical protein
MDGSARTAVVSKPIDTRVNRLAIALASRLSRDGERERERERDDASNFNKYGCVPHRASTVLHM